MDDILKQRARYLRRNMTDAEQLLWQSLRHRQLKGFKFRRQVVVGHYIADFVCLQAKLVIEIDGGQHSDNKNYDWQRTQYLQQQGFQVLRFWNHEVLTQLDDVLDCILNQLASSARAPSP